MRKSFGFIGTGNMGGALARAVAANVEPELVFLSNRTQAKAQALADELGARVAGNQYIAENCDFIFLGVKPQMMADMLSGIAQVLSARKTPFVLVSMAAGLRTDQIQNMAGGGYPVIRIMPNTPVSVGCGLIQYSATGNVDKADMDIFRAALSCSAILDELPEKLIDAGSAISGSGPAFADMFIEALADGGVACGLPRDKAVLYAAQMLQGAARLVIESGKHPGELKDDVCSPGGSTIAGVKALEQRGFRAACIEAVEATYKRATELGK